MEYFPPLSRKLARIRCVLEAIECLRDAKRLPEPLCYFPAVVEYTVDPFNLKLSRTKDNSPKGLDVFESPSIGSDKLLTVDFPADPKPAWIKIRCEGQWAFSSDGVWLDVLELSIDGSVKLDRGYILLENKIEFLVTPLVKNNTRTWYNVAMGLDVTIAKWTNVVEIKYGLTVAKPYLLSKISPPKQEMVDRLRNPPDSTWTLKHDAQLLKFVYSCSEFKNSGSSNLGVLSPYVDRIEVSSSTEGESDDQNANELVAMALTDNDPTTYWESESGSETHFIRLYMKPGVIIDKLFICVDRTDDTYMPSKVLVSVGDTLADLDQINEVDVDLNFTGDVCILEYRDEYAKIVAIEIPECKDDGIDVRIRGIKIKAKPRSMNVGEIRNAFHNNSKRLANFPLLPNYELEALRLRYLGLNRFLLLFDSILPDIFPPAAHESRTFALLEDIRCLLPASRRAAILFDTFLKKTESKPDDLVVPKLIIDRRTAAEARDRLSEEIRMTSSPSAKTIFVQVFRSVQTYNKDADEKSKMTYRFPRSWLQWWEFKFIGEGVIDQGGPFRDVLCDLTDELCPLDPNLRPTLPHFLRIENHFDDGVNGSEGFVPNPLCQEYLQYEFIGTLMGACIRSQEHLVLSFVPFIWKKILGEKLSWEDYATVDSACVKQLQMITTMTEAELNSYFGEDDENNFTCALISGEIVPVCPGGESMVVNYQNRLDYVELVKKKKMAEFDKQIGAIKRGILSVIPQPALNLITWQQLEEKVCGNPIVSVEELKKSVKYDGIHKEEKRVAMLWEALENFSNDERSKFLRFVTGRRRLPTVINLCSEKSENASDTLPESSTCSNALYLPDYTSAELLEQKLRYAIYNCIAIDTDTSPWD